MSLPTSQENGRRGLRAAAMALLLCGGSASGSDLRVAVAANFRAPFAVLESVFAKEQGIGLAPVFAASGLLATQIRQGAPFDLFLSADLRRPQALLDDGLALAPVVTYARGRVALWTLGRKAEVAAMNAERIGMANPRLAPYGLAAQECLRTLALWQRHQERLVYGNNVAQVVHFVASGALGAGFVALGQLVATDVPPDHYWVCPAHAHNPIDQGGVALRRSTSQEAAEAFLQFLAAPTTQAQLASLGYAPLD